MNRPTKALGAINNLYIDEICGDLESFDRAWSEELIKSMHINMHEVFSKRADRETQREDDLWYRKPNYYKDRLFDHGFIAIESDDLPF